MSTVSGLIDSTGSAGSAIGQLFVPVIQNTLGWNYVFYLFFIMVNFFFYLKISLNLIVVKLNFITNFLEYFFVTLFI